MTNRPTTTVRRALFALAAASLLVVVAPGARADDDGAMPPPPPPPMPLPIGAYPDEPPPAAVVADGDVPQGAAMPAPAGGPAGGVLPAPDAPAEGDDAARLSPEALEDLVGRIALYPDVVLSSLLPAAAFPLDCVEAAQLVRQQGGRVAAVPAGTAWNASVQAMLQYPDALTAMTEDVRWLRALADAVATQQEDVLAAVQAFRAKAKAAGNLASDAHATVVVKPAPEPTYDPVICIEPASPSIVYVPVYDPIVVCQPYYAPTPLFTWGFGSDCGPYGPWGWSFISWDFGWGYHHHRGHHGHHGYDSAYAPWGGSNPRIYRAGAIHASPRLGYWSSIRSQGNATTWQAPAGRSSGPGGARILRGGGGGGASVVTADGLRNGGGGDARILRGGGTPTERMGRDPATYRRHGGVDGAPFGTTAGTTTSGAGATNRFAAADGATSGFPRNTWSRDLRNGGTSGDARVTRHAPTTDATLPTRFPTNVGTRTFPTGAAGGTTNTPADSTPTPRYLPRWGRGDAAGATGATTTTPQAPRAWTPPGTGANGQGTFFRRASSAPQTTSSTPNVTPTWTPRTVQPTTPTFTPRQFTPQQWTRPQFTAPERVRPTFTPQTFTPSAPQRTFSPPTPRWSPPIQPSVNRSSGGGGGGSFFRRRHHGD